jgi:hypothetical protein
MDSWRSRREFFLQDESGPYEIKILPVQGCYLNNNFGNVAFFENLVKTTTVGSTGNGVIDETGVSINWRLDSLW